MFQLLKLCSCSCLFITDGFDEHAQISAKITYHSHIRAIANTMGATAVVHIFWNRIRCRHCLSSKNLFICLFWAFSIVLFFLLAFLFFLGLLFSALCVSFLFCFVFRHHILPQESNHSFYPIVSTLYIFIVTIIHHTLNDCHSRPLLCSSYSNIFSLFISFPDWDLFEEHADFRNRWIERDWYRPARSFHIGAFVFQLKHFIVLS